MKKTLVILAVLGVAVLALGTAGYVYAQSQTPPATPQGYAPGTGMPFQGMRPARGGFQGQMMDEDGNPLHDYMVTALADTFGLTPEELEAMHDSGTTLWDYAAEQGYTIEEFQALMQEVRNTALEQAVTDGVITQEQADWMSSHAPRMHNGAGQGDCTDDGPHGHGGSAFHGHGGGKWQHAPAPAQP